LCFRKGWVAVFLSRSDLVSQLEQCHPGDLICCSWTDASIGKTSTNGGVIVFPIPEGYPLVYIAVSALLAGFASNVVVNLTVDTVAKQ
jgi:hypothetical protein